MNRLPTALLLAGTVACTVAPDRYLESVLQSNRAFDSAEFQRDFAAIEVALAPEFTWITFGGARLNREETLAHLRAGDSRYTRYESIDVAVTLLGESAVVTGVLVREGRNSQRSLSGLFRYTRVFVRRGGRWLLVSWQMTAIPEKPAA